MIKPGVFVDHLFLTVMTHVIQRDIIILHMNPNTVGNKMFSWIHGMFLYQSMPFFIIFFMLGCWLETGDNPKPSRLVPVFMLFFEENHYLAGHEII